MHPNTAQMNWLSAVKGASGQSGGKKHFPKQQSAPLTPFKFFGFSTGKAKSKPVRALNLCARLLI
jgi:hypothetical protein